MKGGMLLSPLPLGGAGRRRKTKRLSKKMLKMLKKNPALLKKMMKGGEGQAAAPAFSFGSSGSSGTGSGSGSGSGNGEDGGRRRRRSRKTRRSGLLY